MKFASIILLTLMTAGCGYKTATTPMSATPNIAALTPNNTAAGAPAFTLTITGTAFGAGSVVYFNGVAQPTTFVGATQVSAMIPGTAVANTGAMPVIVRVTTNGQYGTVTQSSNAVNFTVN